MLRLAAASAGLGAVLWTACGAPEGRVDEPDPPPAEGDFDARFRRARARLLDAIEDGGTPDAGTRGTFRELGEERPDDARVIAYLGSIRLLDARSATLPWQKGTAAVEGLDILDRAVALAPESIEVRFVRGRSTLPLPAFFGRSEAAALDILDAADRAAEALREGRIEPFLAAAAFLARGDLLERRGDRDGAAASWRAAARTAPDSRWGRAARDALARTSW